MGQAKRSKGFWASTIVGIMAFYDLSVPMDGDPVSTVEMLAKRESRMLLYDADCDVCMASTTCSADVCVRH